MSVILNAVKNLAKPLTKPLRGILHFVQDDRDIQNDKLKVISIL